MNKLQTKVFIRFDDDKAFIELDDLLERKEKRIEAPMKIKLRRHYCQLDNGPRVRCWYSRGNLGTATDAVTICAKTHCDNLSDVFPADRVENDTDIMTDYFEKDRVRILPGDLLWDDACAMAAARIVN